MATKVDDIVSRVLGSTFSSLEFEAQVGSFDEKFPGLNLKGLPEYQPVIEAMNAFADAASSHYINTLNQTAIGE